MRDGVTCFLDPDTGLLTPMREITIEQRARAVASVFSAVAVPHTVRRVVIEPVREFRERNEQ